MYRKLKIKERKQIIANQKYKQNRPNMQGMVVKC